MRRACKPTAQGLKAEAALRAAVAEAVERNRRLGIPIAVMRNGKAVLLPVREALAAERQKRRRKKGPQRAKNAGGSRVHKSQGHKS